MPIDEKILERRAQILHPDRVYWAAAGMFELWRCHCEKILGLQFAKVHQRATFRLDGKPLVDKDWKTPLTIRWWLGEHQSFSNLTKPLGPREHARLRRQVVALWEGKKPETTGDVEVCRFLRVLLFLDEDERLKESIEAEREKIARERQEEKIKAFKDKVRAGPLPVSTTGYTGRGECSYCNAPNAFLNGAPNAEMAATHLPDCQWPELVRWRAQLVGELGQSVLQPVTNEELEDFYDYEEIENEDP